MMTAMVTVRRRVGPCALVLLLLVRVCAAGCPGRVSGDAGAVVVPVDMSCAPSDGSLSYRVRVCVGVKKCFAAGAEAQCENYNFSGFDVRTHGRNGELGAVCHVANAVHTCSNCAANRATEEEGVTVAFTMNVTTHKYAGPYELWWRQFPPDGTIHPPARSSDADRTGICRLPPPREGRDDTNSGETTAPQFSAEPSRQKEDRRQSAAADGPNTVDRSPASNTATNTSETRPEFSTNPSEVMVPNASKKAPSFANGPRILVVLNASGIMSVTCGGREHVAADNTDEVSEPDATGHKSLVLENGVAVSGFVGEGDAGGLSQRNAFGHENPNYENSPRSIPGAV
ncbi:hypothetical protein Tc00.1047053507067.70 [Trypanosoma cruzi]|uniref:Uncharacterized protein n=1 Tax=Trypanosoma cruzi (strain CL Brener) TaxID=353153 RepID=Q4D7K8_TRYCC|nr:hypothetical protein Tc00.1047053507067.70 [Trypanosoma cruzi]EAN88513.1 hypothetical protein Tc00.1047053507067.70 [Trypanosoma cruzi]|eukprot:XP_810364.1 hypothetical protein [Trypanosoma cruzi strain CL Brener]